MKRWRRSQMSIKSEYFAMYWKFSSYKTRQMISQLTFCLIHGWCASQNLVSYTCSIVSFSFFLRSWIIHCPSIFVPVRHTRPTCRVDWLTLLMCHLVVAAFTIVALWARPRCDPSLRLIRAVTVGNLTARLNIWPPDQLISLPDQLIWFPD